MPLYPVNLDIHGLLCVVIGGGTVASRKIEALLLCGAQIRVVSPIVVERITELATAGLLDWQQRKYEQDDLSGAKLVFAATDNPIVQKQIAADADTAGILVNVIDLPESCSFQVPASFYRGRLLLTVATGGGSPALAARIRKELEVSYGPEYGALVALMAAVRKEIVASSGNSAEHKQLFERLLDSEILNCVRYQRWDELSTLLQNILPVRVDVLSLVRKIRNTCKEEVA
jgi:precorrin-2 dehydrogenase/sirohydrochlorin ferrochelatase